MSCPEVHSGDYGTVIKATVKDCGQIVNISGAQSLTMVFRLPGTPASYLNRDATIASDGSDGVMQYIFQSGELTTLGTWQVQGIYTNASGSWRSDVERFKVLGNF